MLNIFLTEEQILQKTMHSVKMRRIQIFVSLFFDIFCTILV